MKKKYGALIAGAGFMGGVHAKAYRFIENLEIKAIFDKDIMRAQKLSSEFGGKPFSSLEAALMEDVDFVDICLPTAVHKDTAIDCLKMGKDVLCEKPVAISIQDAQTMADEAALAGRMLMVAQVVRFWPEYYKLASTIKGGDISGIKSLSLSRYSAPPAWSEGGWLLDDSLSGGIIYDLCIHDVDFAVWTLGLPKWIFAKKCMLNSHCTGYLNVILGYDDMNVHVEGGYAMPPKYPFTAGFRLSTGNVAYEYMNKSGLGLIKYSNEEEGIKVQCDDSDPYENEIRYFVQCLGENKKPEMCTPEEAIAVLEVLKCIEKSAESNEVITI